MTVIILPLKAVKNNLPKNNYHDSSQLCIYILRVIHTTANIQHYLKKKKLQTMFPLFYVIVINFQKQIYT